MRQLGIVAALLSGLVLVRPAAAEALGTVGPVYPLAEPNLLDFIEARLKEKERSGELARLQQEARSRGTDSVLHPTPIPGIGSVQTARTTYFDPSFTLDRNIVDDKGALMFAAGTRKNPLDVVTLSKRLLFFDARDPRQVAQARRLIDQYHGKVKPILLGGSYIDLIKAWRVPVYFDQQGVLARQLGISAVPAIVSQEGRRLRIDELVVQ